MRTFISLVTNVNATTLIGLCAVEWWLAEVNVLVEAGSQAVQKQASGAAAQRQLEHTQDTEALAAAAAQRAALIESQTKQAEEWLTMQRKNADKLNVPVVSSAYATCCACLSLNLSDTHLRCRTLLTNCTRSPSSSTARISLTA